MSRLDRLVLLLDTGSPVVRNTAAEQLAQVQKAHPHELFNLLGRVLPFLKNSQWDTRVAAAKAIGGILDSTAVFNPDTADTISISNTYDTVDGITEEPVSNRQAYDDKLHFSTFDIAAVIKNGDVLLGSAGKEYDIGMAALSAEERLLKAKQNVTSRLGLGAEYMEDNFLTANDLALPAQIDSPAEGITRTPVHADDSPLQSPLDIDSSMSARQRNMLKRKAKVLGKHGPSKMRVIDVSSSSVTGRRSVGTKGSDEVILKREANDYFSVTTQAQDDSRIVVEHKVSPNNTEMRIENSADHKYWPLEGLVEMLLVDLFDPKWETRHGAASALREVFRGHAQAAGRERGRNRQQNDARNTTYLDDMACRLCCLFALDRFGDYVSDQVVAPIREVVSQTLAALLIHLPMESVFSTFQLLSTLIFQPSLEMKAWEVTHGGMLGLKYLVAIRKDVLMTVPGLLDGSVTAVLHGLADHDDDVRAVSAATLIPIVGEIVQLRPALLEPLLDALWECLADLRDDLSASTGSVMDLLAKLCALPDVLNIIQNRALHNEIHSFGHLIPRLYPFLRHTITSVRVAVLRALQTLLGVEPGTSQEWADTRYFRLLFQNMLLEQNDEVLRLSSELWRISVISQKSEVLYDLTSISMEIGLNLTMTPIGLGRHAIPIDAHALLRPSGQSFVIPPHGTQTSESRTKPRKTKADVMDGPLNNSIDVPMIQGDVELLGYDTHIRARVTAASALGSLVARWPEVRQTSALQGITANLVSTSSTPRMLCLVVLQEYISQVQLSDTTDKNAIHKSLEQFLSQKPPSHYENLTSALHVARSQCQALCNTFVDVGRVPSSKIFHLPALCVGDRGASSNAFDIAMGEDLIGEQYERMCRAALVTDNTTSKALADVRLAASQAIANAKAVQEAEDIRIQAACGCALLAFKMLPRKLNPLIKVLMDSIKRERTGLLQERSAEALSTIVELSSQSGRTTAADKLLKNLCAFLCIDTSETPEFRKTMSVKDGIYSLSDVQILISDDLKEDIRTKHNGARRALTRMSTRFGSRLFLIAPMIRECMLTPLQLVFGADTEGKLLDSTTDNHAQDLIDCLSVIRELAGCMHSISLADVERAAPHILAAMRCSYSAIRYAAGSCFAALCRASPLTYFMVTINDILPMLVDTSFLHSRQGAIETISKLVSLLDSEILPYIIFLIVPILGRMSDPNNDIRILATTTFASLVKLVPLEEGIPDPPGFSQEMLRSRDNERKFIQQMLNGSKVEPFVIPVAIKADLRSYQQDGVNWLAFLNRYQLHGILCDDMGLGKTLQTICIVASDHHNRAKSFEDSGAAESQPLPSLIVCPPSLTGHWEHELRLYAPFVVPLAYVGLPSERRSLRTQFIKADVIITSYDIVRNDIDYLHQLDFNYCVLDEGHIIKNSKAKLTQSVKMLKANHRLILSGTPIQNNVLELWSLFDFLMPGFLGSEKSFYERYAKPIANSRESKTTSKEQESGALALEALHKQVLPFLLRRLKEDVLADLPPKIIQDYYCELSPLQKSLYTEFASSQAAGVASETSNEMKRDAKAHVFQVLQYMRKLCNHPALVVNEKHPKYREILSRLGSHSQGLRDIHHAPKFLALRDLLLDCGIGRDTSTNGVPVVVQHRALIFCQLKDMLDMIESDVFKTLLPTVTYMRLDGTTDPRNRQQIVQTFNADPSIDVLLLTTHVGGLGLNLTGADTVIFVEHDWNPMKDLQAMDRAHRIGQKKTVNVYRLITRGTLEEKIMGLQRFKMNIASTVVNQQNSGLATMETDQILDLFNVDLAGSTTDSPTKSANVVDSQGNVLKTGQKSVFDDLDDLHNENEYDEFNLDNFVRSL